MSWVSAPFSVLMARPLVRRSRRARSARRRCGAGSPCWHGCCRRDDRAVTRSAAASIAAVHRCPTSEAPASSHHRRVAGLHRPIRAAAHRPSSSSVTVHATPMSAKSPRRRATSMKQLPERGWRSGSSTRQHFIRFERSRQRVDEKIGRGHPAFAADAIARALPPSASTIAGISEAGSACERLPPMVPRLRICGCAIWGNASGSAAGPGQSPDRAPGRRSGSTHRSEQRRFDLG